MQEKVVSIENLIEKGRKEQLEDWNRLIKEEYEEVKKEGWTIQR